MNKPVRANITHTPSRSPAAPKEAPSGVTPHPPNPDESRRPAGRPLDEEATKTRLTTFFAAPDNMFGVFYPKDYLLAVYPDEAAARAAGEELREAGWNAGRLLAVSGEEVLAFAEQHLEKGGLSGLLMAELSRLIGTEAAYAEDDLLAAREGAGFLAAHCPSTQTKQEAWRVLAPTRPRAARHYTGHAIELLTPSASRAATV